ncbi:hypothetical protein A2899_02450 [Candidatus Amesbacteria bacterium RIFCSPLOWO2_01_FULL_49_25]|uniref:CDP-alcohol phosphatidyltransferase n=1 Tax=Candidatus Amesbacteria bacterium RIFCSPHIGHO2_01_FULL_48_32b TaxID=1797253 RepID=A0A1F4YEZ7_9BACT|nr:MAG: hypothetical protein A2876_04180 [Candidatus Amesbacteria bacterium RIFCSPHIGHO2_01_FULL_48_32b]OGD08597.1 MAG: hypothetical protein A2899_02450 [Candidatus Amesbacteria bacterium RIFCSPLOWO2_01_FULL_49_25]
MVNFEVGKIFFPAAKFLHKNLGLTPNQISLMSFGVGVTGAGLVWFGMVELALTFLAVSLVLDGLDGLVARAFGLESRRGEWLEVVLDRFSEGLWFGALVLGGFARWRWAALAMVAILLMTVLRDKTGFDPGFKRIVLFLGYGIGFDWVLKIIFGVNLLGFVANLVILDLDLQRRLDAK